MGEWRRESTFDGTTRMPWLEMLKPLPLKLDCYYYIKFDENNLPDAYTTFIDGSCQTGGNQSWCDSLPGQDIL